MKAQELLNNLIDAGQVRLDEIHFKSNPSEKIPAPFKCDVCKVMLNSTQQLEVHYAGKSSQGIYMWILVSFFLLFSHKMLL